MYSLADFHHMMVDGHRMQAYDKVIKQAVRPGDVVVDVGTGAGIMAFMAAKSGASKVYAIEPAQSVEIARSVAAANGFADRIVFIRGGVDDVDLPERVDVLLSDIRGQLPPFLDNFRVIAKARDKYLKPGGRMVPLFDELHMALVRAPLVREPIERWDRAIQGVDYSEARDAEVNTYLPIELQTSHLRSHSECVGKLDYTTGEVPAGQRFSHRFEVDRPRQIDGVAMWFDAHLFGDIVLRHGPGQPKSVYGRGYFPLAQPVDLDEGEVVDVRIETTSMHNDNLWSWRVRIGDGTTWRFEGQHSNLRKLLAGRRAKTDDALTGLSSGGAALLRVLEAMRAGRAASECAAELLECHADQFANLDEAMTYVATQQIQFALR